MQSTLKDEISCTRICLSNPPRANPTEHGFLLKRTDTSVWEGCIMLIPALENIRIYLQLLLTDVKGMTDFKSLHMTPFSLLS
jgi:hypothetical protein